jgi:hypothetical protein
MVEWPNTGVQVHFTIRMKTPLQSREVNIESNPQKLEKLKIN